MTHGRRLLVTTALSAAVTLMAATPSQAAMKMAICGAGVAVCTVMADDGTGVDAVANNGVIIYVGAFGTFTLTVDTGQSDPSLLPPLPHMDLSYVHTGVGELFVWLTDTDFTDLGAIRATGGGSVANVTDAHTDWFAWIDGTNTEFAGQVPPGTVHPGASDLSCGPFGPAGFSCDDTFVYGGASPYSITMLVHVVHPTSGVSSGNFELYRTVPEPATLALFGLGLLGLSRIRRRR